MSDHQTDFIEAGRGEKVILVHSSVAGANQWRALMQTLSGDYHLIAINLFGYGKTPPWTGKTPQTLEDQARLIEPFLPRDGQRVSLVGHSFGGSVAMKAAALFRPQIDRLVLIEPNPFYLLDQNGRHEAFEEATALRDVIKTHGKSGSWDIAAETFADYWTGPGSWDAMSQDRRAKFARGLQPNFHEWDAVLNERTTLSEWERTLPKDTTLFSALDTVRSIDEIVALMEKQMSGWHIHRIEQGGHMALLTRPDIFNPLVEKALRPPT